ncbi:hypothetical protein RMATCC62417_14315 [Rhizopus microsporus]|nr:hypothetical protein RMATCC62417_14315 [Rhizopus microsporus]
MKDVATDGNFKVDMRVLNDSVVHQYNEERDLAVAEAGKNDPGSFKYQSNRCKLLSESKVIIDNSLHGKNDVDTVYPIYFCGFEIMVMSLSLSANDLYVGNEVHHIHLDDRLQRYCSYLQTATALLCFRDEAIKVSTAFDNFKSINASERTSVKYNKYNRVTNNKPVKLYKSSWTRETWISLEKKISHSQPSQNGLDTHNDYNDKTREVFIG